MRQVSAGQIDEQMSFVVFFFVCTALKAGAVPGVSGVGYAAA